MLARTNVIAKLSMRDIVPTQYYPLCLALVFVVSLAAAYFLISPVNHDDWLRTAQQLRFMLQGTDPYCIEGCEAFRFDPDLAWSAVEFNSIAYSPWYIFFFSSIAYSSTSIPIALTVAFWIVIILDIGYLPALFLVLHPSFIMLWASGNIDFLVSGVGLWFVLRGARGWRRGIALLLIAVKPQTLILLLLLEGLRILWESDWKAFAIIGVVVSSSIVLFPGWFTEMVPAYLTGGFSRSGVAFSQHIEISYPFSVYGAWGIGAALLITILIVVIMLHRLTEWRTLAVLLSFVWTPFVNPYNFAVLLLLFRRTAPWRIGLYLGLSLLTLPILFGEYHMYERYGTLLFLLGAALLSEPDLAQREEIIARRGGHALLPLVKPVARFRDRLSLVTSWQKLI